MKWGFRFAETMSGTFAMKDTPDEHRRFSFTIEARAESTIRHLKDGKTHMTGTLDADGFANHVPLDGVLTLLPVTRKYIRYEFNFTADDGKPYRFAGQKDIRLMRLLESFTTLPGTIYDSRDDAVATAATRFDAKADLFQFLLSWRPA